MRILFTIIFLLATTLWAQNSSDSPVITIVHTNDTHSQIEPAIGRITGQLYGGAVERASLLEIMRQQDPDLIYLDAGDMVQGSPYFNLFKGELEMLCMNQMGLIASTFGNHEFDNGIEGISAMLEIADFPFISCNYHCEGTALETRVIPHLILVNHGVKIGITGVTCDPEGLITASNWSGITYEDPSLALNREARTLRNEGCDLVIVLSHVGYIPDPSSEKDRQLDPQLAQASEDIDLIIGAHTHVNIERGVTYNNANGQPVVITQTGGKASPIGCLQITMKPGSRYEGCQYSVDSIVCSKLHPEDYDLTGLGKDIEELIAPYREAMGDKMHTHLADAPLPLEKGHPQSRLGNFTTDAMLKIGEQITGKPIDAALTNVGGLRSEISAGEVTIGTLYSIFPFENSLVVLDLKGSDLKQLIESNAGRKLDCWAGTQITIAMDGDRCIATEILIGGQPIDPERIYHVCTIDYLAEGNSGMSALTHAVDARKTGITIREAMINYIDSLGKQGKQVTAEIDDRVIDHTK